MVLLNDFVRQWSEIYQDVTRAVAAIAAESGHYSLGPAVAAFEEQLGVRSYGEFEIHGELRHAQAFATREVSVPIHPSLLDTEMEAVVDARSSWRSV